MLDGVWQQQMHLEIQIANIVGKKQMSLWLYVNSTITGWRKSIFVVEKKTQKRKTRKSIVQNKII